MSTPAKPVKAADPAGAATGTAAAAKKRSKLPLIIAAAAVVALGGGGAAFWFMRGQAPAGDTPAAAAASSTRETPIYYKFEPAFVVNFGAEGNVRYLQVTLEAMSRDPLVIEAIKNNEPAIRNDVVLLFSAQQYEVLMLPEGKDKLRQGTLEAVRKVISEEGAKGAAVEGDYFTSFVIQ